MVVLAPQPERAQAVIADKTTWRLRDIDFTKGPE